MRKMFQVERSWIWVKPTMSKLSANWVQPRIWLRAVAVRKGEYGLNHHVGREASKRFYVVDI